MQNIVVLLAVIMTFGNTQESALSRVRTLYQKAANDESAAKSLLSFTADFDEDQPVLMGYNGAAHMMMAKHVINPFSKMSHFNKGKRIYNSAILVAPENIELRFLRFAVQSEAPGFLGYKENIAEDKKFLMDEVLALKDQELKKMILDYLLASKNITAGEKIILKEKSN